MNRLDRDRCGTERVAGVILRNRLQKFDKLPRSSTLDGVDLYVFGVLHGETIRQTKQRVCLYSLLGTEAEARISGSGWVRRWWFVYRAARMAIYLTDKTDRWYQSPGYKWHRLSRRSSTGFHGARQNGRKIYRFRVSNVALEYIFNFSYIKGLASSSALMMFKVHSQFLKAL